MPLGQGFSVPSGGPSPFGEEANLHRGDTEAAEGEVKSLHRGDTEHAEGEEKGIHHRDTEDTEKENLSFGPEGATFIGGMRSQERDNVQEGREAADEILSSSLPHFLTS